MLTGPYVDLVSAKVDQVASWYSRRVWWIEHEELVQEGWVAALDMLLRLDAADVVEESLGGMIYTAVVRHLSKYCRYASGVRQHEFGVVDPDSVPCLVTGEVAHARRAAELESDQLRYELDRRVKELRMAWRGVVDMRLVEATIAVLVHGAKPGEAAAACGVDVRSVYYESRLLKRQVARDPASLQILSQIQEARSLQ